jgi:phosphate transport system substrate-binding protein
MQRLKSTLAHTTLYTVIILLTSLAGCGRNDTQGGADETQQYLMIKGSDTMVHLASTWAESYMDANPNAEISVTGGGSGTGIAALINGTTDICAASRSMKEKEYQLASANGAQPQEFVVARDGIAVVVNPTNPVGELSVEQIGKIYTGAYTNWNHVGGPNENIIVLSRESSSGTYVFFQENVLKKKDYTQSARLMPATSAIIQSVSTDTWTIGYVGLGYAMEAGSKVQMLSVKAASNSPAIVPSEETVSSGDYSIARPLHLYTTGAPQNLVKNFIDYCLSVAGQKIVRETGYVGVQ